MARRCLAKPVPALNDLRACVWWKNFWPFSMLKNIFGAIGARVHNN